MSKSMRKRTAFWSTLTVLVGLFALAAIRDQLAAVGPVIVTMIAGNAAAYIGGSVAHAWQRSKYYRSELDGK